eukprot:gnl/TRDRNA2_/TRDRNA2_140179_c0_seq1.p1 gnl/TRDRNA2_/TRDRNA2_140179_c0~~gnl/TRDRNA2_/TRDRNA2_140179_c0_seq1.p1  ORF type:complete len:526 (-),score=63.66 gnl/TRDRNA2_/TRDRNA2_140179_c0_seq1:173-1669(-)
MRSRLASAQQEHDRVTQLLNRAEAAEKNVHVLMKEALEGPMFGDAPTRQEAAEKRRQQEIDTKGWVKVLLNESTAMSVGQSKADEIANAAARLAELATSGDVKAMTGLLDALEQGHVGARCAAAAAVGTAAGANSKQRLRRLQSRSVSSSKSRKSRSSSRGSAVVTEGNLVDALTTATADAEAEVRLAAVRALKATAREADEDMMEVLEQCCYDDDVRVQTAALDSYADMVERGCLDVRRPLRVFLDRARTASDPKVRASAVAGIARVAHRGHSESIVLLRALMQQDMGDPPALTHRHDTRTTQRAAAILALGAVANKGDKDILQEICHCVGDDDFEVRCAVASALVDVADRGEELAMRILLRLCEDEDNRVRQAAVSGLGVLSHRGDKDVTAKLLKRIEREANSDVRRLAICSLTKVAAANDQRVKAAVARGSEDQLWGVRSAAQESIYRLHELESFKRSQQAVLRGSRCSAIAAAERTNALRSPRTSPAAQMLLPL